MDKLVINGQKRLCGEVSISGAKNAAVAILPAAIMADGVCIIENLPNIEDVTSLFSTLVKIGAKCEFIDNHTLTALTLLVAESNPKEKEVMIDLIMNFLTE